MVNFSDCDDAAIIKHKDGNTFYMTFHVANNLFLMPLWSSSDEILEFYGEKSDWLACELAEAQWLHRHNNNN